MIKLTMKDAMEVSWTMPLSSSLTMVALTVKMTILTKDMIPHVTPTGSVFILKHNLTELIPFSCDNELSSHTIDYLFIYFFAEKCQGGFN